jgi:hypothetical protein
MFATIPKAFGFEVAIRSPSILLGGSLHRKASPRESRLSYIEMGMALLWLIAYNPGQYKGRKPAHAKFSRKSVEFDEI